MSDIIQSLADISDRYDAVFCDLWGCLHNGNAPFSEAVAALEAFKAKGGVVVLLTNAPRPDFAVAKQLEKINVSRDLYDVIVSSGDAARQAMIDGAVGRKVYHLGPEKDLGFFKDIPEDIIQRVPLAQADGIVCTGLFDDRKEGPNDYTATYLEAKNKGLKMLCANPDIVVDMGETRIYCAGALAAAYTGMGGESLYFGKPHPPIYDLARRKLAAIRADISDARILCIGDGIYTDIQGAIGEDLDSLFISGGLAAEETGTNPQPDAAKLQAFLNKSQLSPRFTVGHLR